MRIVSLVPSATEIVAALGLAEDIAGISHDCDFPPAVREKARVLTHPLVPHPGDPVPGSTDEDEELVVTAADVDQAVREAVQSGQPTVGLDRQALIDLKPDVVITQGLCDVCALGHRTAAEAAAALGGSACVLDVSPTSLEGVLRSFHDIGGALARHDQAEALAGHVSSVWDSIAARVAPLAERPRTLLLEWPDPPYSAGHWSPELLRLAGATAAPWDAPGARSRQLSWDDIQGFAPEVIVLIGCGLDAYEGLDEAVALAEFPGWFDLPAVRAGECYSVDGNAYFNRPGPRLAESAQILATILHPEAFTDMLPPYSVQRFGSDLMKPETV